MITQTRAGEVYWLNFDEMNLEEPEMIKKRMVTVISSWTLDKRRNLVTVVPLSATAPKQPNAKHIVPLSKEYAWVKFEKGKPCQLWAKCDMIYTPSIDRLEPVERVHRTNRRGIGANQKDPTPRLNGEDMRNIKLGVAHALGLSKLLVDEVRTSYMKYHKDKVRTLLPWLFSSRSKKDDDK